MGWVASLTRCRQYRADDNNMCANMGSTAGRRRSMSIAHAPLKSEQPNLCQIQFSSFFFRLLCSDFISSLYFLLCHPQPSPPPLNII